MTSSPTLESFVDFAERSPNEALHTLASPSFWARFGAPTAAPSLAVEGTPIGAARANLAREGYASVPGVVPRAASLALAERVRALSAGGWDASFALVFDEVWTLGRALVELTRRAAGDHLGFAGEAFAFCVDPSLSAGRSRGVEPHRDRPGSGFVAVGEYQSPRHCTAWLALTDATVANGCIHVVPASAEGDAYRSAAPKPWPLDRGVPLECEAGTALLWGGHAIHWGGVHDAAAGRGPRIALAFAATAPEIAAASPLRRLTGLVRGGRLPTLTERLMLLHTMSRFLYPPRAGSLVARMWAAMGTQRPPTGALAVPAGEARMPPRARATVVDRDRVTRAIERGVGYLTRVRAERRDALCEDFALEDGSRGSTEWVSGFIAAHIGGITEGQALAKELSGRLLQQVRPVGGWAYREGVMSDCDSTAWVLLGAARAHLPIPAAIKRRALGVILNHQTESGGFATYTAASRPLFAEGHQREGWFEAQPCVAAAAGLAMLEAGGVAPAAIASLWRYLQQARAPSGLWAPYWWETFTYATYNVARALKQAGALSPADLVTLRGAVCHRRNADGGWGNDAASSSNAFATSLALLSLRLGSESAPESGLLRALDYLLGQQAEDGAFAPSATLRIPGGRGDATVTITDRGPFTTACALHALNEVRPWLDS